MTEGTSEVLASNGKSRRTPRFDPTINWGHILIAVSFFVGGLLAWGDLKSDLRVDDLRIQIMEKSQTAMAAAITKLAEKSVTDALQDEKIKDLDTRLGVVEVKIERLQGAGHN